MTGSLIFDDNMRITSGMARGISLQTPKGDATRPATDAARQAIFSSIGPAIEGARVLDLFAGTGSYGLEAISRGAKAAVFAESGRQAIPSLLKNLETVKKSVPAAEMRVFTNDAFKFSDAEGFDFIFADPPYRMLAENETLAKIFAAFARLSSPETVIVLEAPGEFEITTKLLEECGVSNNVKYCELKRLGKKSKGKPSQLIFNLYNERA